MKLTQIYIKSFGKLKDRKITFGDGINIVYGPNESGKSTLHAFIRSMLFGITRQRGRAARTDSYSRYEPWERPADFAGILWFESGGKEFRLERSFYKNDVRASLVCVTDGERLSIEDGDLRMLLGEISENVYDNTVSVGQLSSETDAGLTRELQNRMSGYEGGLDGDLNIQAASESLRKRRREWEKKKQDALQRQEENRRRLLERMEYAGKERENLEIQLTAAREQTKEAGKKLEKERQTASDACFAGNTENQLRKEGRKEAAKRQAGQEYEEEHRHSARVYVRLTVWALGLLLILLALLNPWQISIIARAVVAWLGIMAISAVYLFKGSSHEREPEEREEIRSGTEDTKSEKEPAESEAVRRMEGDLSRLQGREEELERQVQEKATEEENLREDYEEMDQNDTEVADCELEIRSLNLALETLESLSGNIRLRAGDKLRGRMGEILSQLTGGKYTQVSLDRDMNMELGTREHLIPLASLSRGTVEQVYFALRMAVGEILCQEEPLPILLDEVFAMYDDERLSAALNWLARQERQTLIFTCHTREARLARREGIAAEEISMETGHTAD